MKKLALGVALALTVSIFGCNASTTASDISNALGALLSIAQAEEPQIAPQDQAAFTSWVTLGQTLNAQLMTCITQAQAAGGKAAAFLACYNTFATGLASPAEMVQLRLLSPKTQSRVQLYLTAATVALNVGIKAFGGASAVAPTVPTVTTAPTAAELRGLAAEAGVNPRFVAMARFAAMAR